MEGCTVYGGKKGLITEGKANEGKSLMNHERMLQKGVERVREGVKMEGGPRGNTRR